MDPLSTVAAVVGVADVGCRLSLTLIRYSNAVVTPSKAIKAIHPEITLLSVVLQQLKNGLSDPTNLRFYNPQAISGAYDIAISCKTALEEIQVIIERYFMASKVTITDRLKRYQKEKEVNLLGANLERLKTSIVLILEVIQFARNLAEDQHGNREEDKKYVLKAAQAKEAATANFNKLAAEPPPNLVGVVSNFATTNFSSDSKKLPYAVLNNGAVAEGDAMRITELIDEIVEIQKPSGGATDLSVIWEESQGENGPQRYRKTIISTMPTMDGTRSIEGLQDPMNQMNQMAPIANQMTDMYIALMGAVGAGKSSFVNICCDENLVQISQGPGHCTESIGEYHFMYTPEIRIHLLDTPGFNDGHRTEREILTDLAEWMSQSRGANARLSGIIYFHKISDTGMKVSAHRNFRLFEKLCGPDAFHSIILATTNWNFFGDPDANVVHEQDLHTQDEYWGLMMKRGSSIVRHTGDRDSAMRVLAALGPLRHAQPVANPYAQQIEPMDRKRGMSEAGIAFEAQSNEATINQLLAQYTTIVAATPTVRRWSVDPLF